MKLTKLKLNPDNPRLIKDEKFKKLVASIKDFPKMMELRPIVVDTSMSILGGNMRYRALSEAGYTEIPDNWVKIADKLTEEEKKRFIIEDNMPFGEWDWEILANNYEIDDLLAWGFNENELKIKQDITEDEAPEVSDEPAISKLGEVYQLGKHRLMCGDSTKIEDVEKLMDGKKADMVFTDPPYGVDYGEKNRFLNSFQKAGRNLKDIVNDNLSKDELYQMLTSAFTNAYAFGQDYCSYYVTAPQGGELGLMMMMMMMMNSGLPVRHVLIWVKNTQNFSLGRLDYEYKHEPILYTWKKTHKFYGKGDCSVWEIDKPRHSDLHPTMKPIELVARAINNSSKQDDIVLDLFGGSGSTLIACEQTNRTCYMMEIDPKYTDVIRKRYAKFIGEEAQWEKITPIVKQ